MPRLKQVTREKASPNVLKFYDALFGERDPVASPGTATGTPGNWWTVFALVPYVFQHATDHFGMFGMFADKSISHLDPTVRELAIMRTGFAQGSQFVFSQHCKAARRFGISEDQIAAISHWQISSAFSAKERSVLAWVDALTLEGGRASDTLFDELHQHLSDEDILELTYHTLCYNMHAVCCKALRLEYDDVDERVCEIPVPEGNGNANWAGKAWRPER
ncbi:MAG: carboxymuconolactone decarboxylase family protein [Acidobacteriota bacterium]|nr:carboxymuconolactone decarboxylase family protein [Acidobacteriota bacterium]